MLLTAYFVINATSVYTAGDTHLSDMQLEVLGNDVLKMMDTPPNNTVQKSSLVNMIENDRPEEFKAMFLNLTNNRTLSQPDHVNFAASYSCRNLGLSAMTPLNSVQEIHFTASRNLTGGEHAVRVTKWVIVHRPVCDSGVTQDRAVLVEVLIWRD
jgi:hypothetical protein